MLFLITCAHLIIFTTPSLTSKSINRKVPYFDYKCSSWTAFPSLLIEAEAESKRFHKSKTIQNNKSFSVDSSNKPVLHQSLAGSHTVAIRPWSNFSKIVEAINLVRFCNVTIPISSMLRNSSFGKIYWLIFNASHPWRRFLIQKLRYPFGFLVSPSTHYYTFTNL